ncbi:hypothetical protein [Sinorhizobium meliloti]|uniref:hypothetical protein n=1 Tax=Rhizobium meliloti TaxID=382 RepID=UPI000FD80C07|nr:hypothetical protein [Sinorhizobium meliloti]RVO57768.1 hypothetical protein CN092_11905 [Sinorhizobium meliloti]
MNVDGPFAGGGRISAQILMLDGRQRQHELWLTQTLIGVGEPGQNDKDVTAQVNGIKRGQPIPDGSLYCLLVDLKRAELKGAIHGRLHIWCCLSLFGCFQAITSR